MLFFLFWTAIVDSDYVSGELYNINISGSPIVLEIYAEEYDEITIIRENGESIPYQLEIPSKVEFNTGEILNVTHVRPHAFNNTNMTSLTFPSTINLLGYEIFANSQVRFVDISTCNLTKLTNMLFCYARELEEIRLPPGITEVPYACFYECYNLTTFTLPKGISLNKNGMCFSFCEKITSLDFSASIIDTIPDYCFYNCISLTNLILPKWNFGGVLPFYNAPLKNLTLSKNVLLSDYLLGGTTFKTFNLTAYGVTVVPYGLFYSCKFLETVILSPGTSQIKGYAFQNCTSLKIDHFNDSYSLGNGIFFACTNITYFDLKNNNYKYIPEDMFKLSGILKIDLPPAISRLGKSCFEGSAIKSLNPPESLAYIDSKCFCQSKIEAVNLANTKLSIISGFAFSGCSQLRAISLPDRTLTINICAFSNCGNLTRFLIKSRCICEIGIFSGCSSLKTVMLGYNSYFYSSAFENCASLESLCAYSDNNFPYYISDLVLERCEEKMFFNCTSIKKVVFSGSVPVISNNCFFNCTSLEICDLSKSDVVEIKRDAFRYCNNLKKFILPDCLIRIIDYAFSNISSLNIYYCGNKSFIANAIFSEGTVVNYYSVNNISLGSLSPIIINRCPTDEIEVETDTSSSSSTTTSEIKEETETSSSESTLTSSSESTSSGEKETMESSDNVLPLRTHISRGRDEIIIDLSQKETEYVSVGSIVSICVVFVLLCAFLIFCYAKFKDLNNVEYNV
jgi:hypothetical protein